MRDREITRFGKELRKHRIDREEKLKDMAEKLGVSAGYLSAIETGAKRAPDDLVNKVVVLLGIDQDEAQRMRRLAAESAPRVQIKLTGAGSFNRQVSAAFARLVETGEDNTVNRAKLKQIWKIIQDGQEEGN